MKRRRGWVVTDATGTRWHGDCPLWAAEQRHLGLDVQPMTILGSGRWPCSSCEHGMHRIAVRA